MKLWIESADAAYQIDETLNNNLLQHLPLGLGMGHDAAIVPISWFPNYSFNEKLRHFAHKWILFDFMEPHAPHPEYDKFWAWVAENPPILTFRRELTQNDVHNRLRPIEWPCRVPPEPPQTKEAFDARPITVLFSWGYSHESRPRLQGDIWKGFARDGIEVIAHPEQFKEFPVKTEVWAAFYTPHWCRKPIEEVMEWQAKSKVTISMPGNGRKCFRGTEAPINSIMALWDDDTAYSYPWTDENSIRMMPRFEYASLRETILTENLYDIYVKSQENIKLYWGPTYARDYVAKCIEEVL